MPRKRIPIPFLRALRSRLLRISALRKPIITQKLLILLSKLKKRQDLKFLLHNHRGFLGEYQFAFSPANSASTTPLIHRRRRRGGRDLCSFFYLHCCLGATNFKVDDCQHPPLPIEDSDAVIVIGDEDDDLFEPFDCGDEQGAESVDQRAEMFIQRFYHQMRMQSHQSI